MWQKNVSCSCWFKFGNDGFNIVQSWAGIMFSGELEFLAGRQVEVGAKFDNPLRWWKNFSQLKTWQTKWNLVTMNFFVSLSWN